MGKRIFIEISSNEYLLLNGFLKKTAHNKPCRYFYKDNGFINKNGKCVCSNFNLDKLKWLKIKNEF